MAISVAGLTPSVPLRTSGKSQYRMIETYNGLVKQNFKNLLLTSPGERIMDPHFGVGLRNFLFESNNQATYDKIGAKISQQVARYMPFMNVTGIRFTTSDEDIDNSTVTVRVSYTIIPLGVEEVLDIDAIRAGGTL